METEVEKRENEKRFFDTLDDEDRRTYLRELIELAMMHDWVEDEMEEGKFFGRKKNIKLLNL